MDIEKAKADNLSLQKDVAGIKAALPGSLPLSSAAGIATEPLSISTEMVTTTSALLSGNRKDTSTNLLATLTLSKRTPLTSPETKGILESIPVKNTELCETIQKLECAIQRKTPVATVLTSARTTPTSTNTATDQFFDDSMDSTDSERRLVIEDVAEEATDAQKSSPIQAHSTETSRATTNLATAVDTHITKIISGNLVPQADGVHVPIPLKVVPTNKSPVLAINATNMQSDGPVTTANIQLHPSTVKMSTHSGQQLTITSVSTTTPLTMTKITQSIPVTTHLQAVNESKKEDVLIPISTIANTGSSSNIQAYGNNVKLVQRAANVIPIVVPDIPVSVVVAPTAVPSVVAAAQAAAAALQCPKSDNLKTGNVKTSASTTLSTNILTTSSSVNSSAAKTFEVTTVARSPAVAVVKNQPSSLNIVPSCSMFSQPPTTHSSSGFFLDASTDLRPEDGVQPISDAVPRPSYMQEKANVGKDLQTELRSDDLSTLLCEETIPGSPASTFGGKDDTPHIPIRSGSNGNDGNDLVNNSTTGNMTLSTNATMNSSPNDSASQDDSSEDLKKNMDVESELTTRKRRRTRKFSEIVPASNEHKSKRRRQPVCVKKSNPGSDTDDNSDSISQRISSTMARQHTQLSASNASGLKPCPYNFLVELDPNLSSDQCIAIIFKQMQDIRKAYNMLKSDLASIDRRRKKMRRREREKKQQQLQSQQQTKISS